MKAKKFKELNVGDVIYYCAVRSSFNKPTILKGDILKVRTLKVDKIRRENGFVVVEDCQLGRILCLHNNVMKEYRTYHIYSTSKIFIENEIKYYYESYITSLKEKVKDGKKAEKDLEELKNITVKV